MQTIIEGKAKIRVRIEAIPTREMAVFYNPVMQFNRDSSIALLNALGRRSLTIADPLAGSGVRAVRMALELKKGTATRIIANDLSASAVRAIKENIKLNPGTQRLIEMRKGDARAFLTSGTFDYVDIDPFGYPGPFIDSAFTAIAEKGILAVTATDTAALTGSAPKACVRKYHATNTRGFLMHELGLRILIGWVAREAEKRGKRVEPLFSYSKDHYMRTIVRVTKKGRHRIGNAWWDAQSLAFGTTPIEGAFQSGPLWIGRLGSPTLVKKVSKALPDHAKFLDALLSDTQSVTVGAHDIHLICKKIKSPAVPPLEKLIVRIREEGYPAARTHCAAHAIKSTIPTKKLEELIQTFGARQ